MKPIFIGSIKIENLEGEKIRLTIDTEPYLDPQIEQLEAEGQTLSEALLKLHQFVEFITE